MLEPIYISRPVNYLDMVALQGFAQNLGLNNVVADMHVTLAYSRDAVDWDAPAFQMDPRPLTISGGNREVSMLDDGAVVLEIESTALRQRWAQFIMAGASWDHPEFRPHITLAYDESFTGTAERYVTDIRFEREIRELLFIDYVSETV